MILLDTDIISASMRTGPDMDVTRWMHGNRGIAKSNDFSLATLNLRDFDGIDLTVIEPR